MSAPHRLRVEHLGDAALGIGERRPRLSWQLPDGARVQTGYQLELNGAPQEPVEASECVLTPMAARSARSRRAVVWRVKVWTDVGESDWSQAAWFETGLLEPGDWTARWIAPAEPYGHRRANAPRTCSARGSWSEHPAMRACTPPLTASRDLPERLPGRRPRVGAGFTAYWANLHVQVYDVGALLLDRRERVAGGPERWVVSRPDGQLAVLGELRRRTRLPRTASRR